MREKSRPTYLVRKRKERQRKILGDQPRVIASARLIGKMHTVDLEVDGMSATLIQNLQTAATKKDRGPARVVRAADVQELRSLGEGGHPPSSRVVTVEREVQMTVMMVAAEEVVTMAPAPTLHPQAVHDI